MASFFAPSRAVILFGHAIPGDARPQLGKLVGGIAAGEHVEHAFERGPGQIRVRRGAANRRRTELAGVPIVHRHHGDDLLRQHVERIARIADALHFALVHGARDGGAGHQIAAKLREDDGRTDAADMMAGAADALHAARHRRRRFDLHHQIDRAHIDAQFERGGGDDAAQRSQFQALFDLLALRRGHAAVMRADQHFAGKFIDRAGDALRQAAAVDEDQRGGVRPHQFQQLGMNRAPDGRPLGPLRGGAAGNGPRSRRGASCRRAAPRCDRSSFLGALASTMVTGR